MREGYKKLRTVILIVYLNINWQESFLTINKNTSILCDIIRSGTILHF